MPEKEIYDRGGKLIGTVRNKHPGPRENWGCFAGLTACVLTIGLVRPSGSGWWLGIALGFLALFLIGYLVERLVNPGAFPKGNSRASDEKRQAAEAQMFPTALVTRAKNAFATNDRNQALELLAEALEICARQNSLYGRGVIHREIAAMSEGARRDYHLEEARKAWRASGLSMAPALIEALDREFCGTPNDERERPASR